jgi:hypothetical protein
MSAADAERVAVLAGLCDERAHQLSGATHDHLARVAQLKRESGVEHIRGGEPVVQPASGLAHGRGCHVHERRHVVVRDPLALLHGFHVEARAAQRLDVARRDHPAFRQHLAHGELHFQPGIELALLRPDPAHLGSGVAGNQARAFNNPGCGRRARRRSSRR